MEQGEKGRNSEIKGQREREREKTSMEGRMKSHMRLTQTL
jgi:hypothetical protein